MRLFKTHQKHILFLSLILLLLLQQTACISVQSMRYRRGLNIQLSGAGSEKTNSAVRKPKGRALKQQLQTRADLPQASVLPDTLPESSAVAELLEGPEFPEAGSSSFTWPGVHSKSVKQIRHHVSDSDRYKKRGSETKSGSTTSSKTSAHERSAFSVMLYALTGLFIGMLCVIMFLLALLTVPLVLFLAVIAMLVISYYGIHEMKKGWSHARERSAGFQLLYILLCAPGFIICGLMYLIGWMVLEGLWN